MKQLQLALAKLLRVLAVAAPLGAVAQPTPPPAKPLSRQECVEFALKNQPAVRQAVIDQEIGERNIRIGLSSWLPQIQGTAALAHNVELPTSVFPNLADPAAGPQIVRIGLKNTSTLGLQATQLIYSNDVIRAARSARYIRQQTGLNTTGFKIDVVTNVSKAFYDILLTQEQLKVLNEAIRRQEKQLKDSKAQYDVGIADKTDYKRAEISVRNAYAERKTTTEALKGKDAYLKQLMGLDAKTPLTLTYDTLQLVQEVMLDTAAQLAVERRVEIQQLQTQQKLQRLNIDFFRYGFLPSLSAYGNYNRVFQNNEFSQLYNTAFPNSQIGLQLAVPIFTGTRRLQNLRIAELQQDRLDLDVVDTRNQINTEYQQALATYKSALNDLNTQRANVTDAREVYKIIKLQYDEGIKTYLEVITAENDLRNAQFNYYNSLYGVLASKLDVQRALGDITF
ncbi:TolC family protein [Hymenobacter sp. BT683]|uniref:TolC family protein n=1 Tax=Hymenobacter jeongseonensis TaxID=2791027 RepID=A0ABS0IEW6_9BACT|nr:TolC family protein [Hymenobacter jeongseonensis]MBF9236880.1 TolC family protein [Hymenobacter jeongseonensis]